MLYYKHKCIIRQPSCVSLVVHLHFLLTYLLLEIGKVMSCTGSLLSLENNMISFELFESSDLKWV
jgi:hypothetical protein